MDHEKRWNTLYTITWIIAIFGLLLVVADRYGLPQIVQESHHQIYIPIDKVKVIEKEVVIRRLGENEPIWPKAV